MKVLVTRHGQTDWNVEGRIQGRTDIPLNKKGIQQAYQTSEELKNEKIELILSSPLQRCKQTAEIINQYQKVPIIWEDSLLEISYGEMEGRSNKDFENREGFGNIIKGKTFKNAETSTDFKNRVFKLLEELKNFKEKKILLVTHNEVCKAINLYFSETNNECDLNHLGIRNCGVVKYEI